MAAQKRLLYMATVWPEASSSAAGVRSMGMLESLLQQGWQVTVSSACKPNAFMQQLQIATGIHAVHTPLNDSCAAEALLSGQLSAEAGVAGEEAGPPDVVLFDRFYEEERFGHFVQQHVPQAATILDTQDLHSVRLSRQAYVESCHPWQASIEQAVAAVPALDDATFCREMAAMNRCDMTLVCSDWEKHFLTDVVGMPRHKVALASFYYANMEQEHAAVPDAAAFAARHGFVFIGNYQHPPNADAAQWLARLWPSLRARLPDATLNLYGAKPGAVERDLHNPSKGVFMHGHVADIGDPLRSHRVMLAPLRFGAGVKGKVLDAWAHGLPVVTTSIGAEGILPLDMLHPPAATLSDSDSEEDTPGRQPVQAGDAVLDTPLFQGLAGQEEESHTTAALASDDEYAAVRGVPRPYPSGLRTVSAAGWRVGAPLSTPGLSGLLASAMGSSSAVEEAKEPPAHLDMFERALLCEDDSAVVEAAVAMYSDAEVWANAAAQGAACLHGRFAQSANGPAFGSVVAGLLASLPRRRAGDLARSLAWHSQASYTRYFSRYLEAKAKNEGR